ncbi:fumarate hydratase [Halarsenatibacter silvermanii]|uniref:Fumarase, class I alpha subunit n=1 Tax=Halarsenatibacter silvermanii TaxID=321763 RepID=A0A1G9RI36_9FIRM|nr:fumarase, class I alpha subunit [Halarsenatibacter silvermanii]
MRKIKVDEITEEVARLAQESNYYLPDEMEEFLDKAARQEESPAAREALEQIRKNAEIAAEEKLPMCQDTGVTVVFAEIGSQVELVGGTLREAVNAGVRKGYKEGYLRKSIVKDPAGSRENTGDNTPAVIHTELVSGDDLKLTVAPKGGGSENMSRLEMLTPAAGVAGVKDFVVDTVIEAGPNPCPPIIVGVGIGGNFEKCALLAKKALLEPLTPERKDSEMPELEKELLEEINKSGIGAQGFGGITTALAVNIKTHPCHIASLPVAVNINCHAARHKSTVI